MLCKKKNLFAIQLIEDSEKFKEFIFILDLIPVDRVPESPGIWDIRRWILIKFLLCVILLESHILCFIIELDKGLVPSVFLVLVIVRFFNKKLSDSILLFHAHLFCFVNKIFFSTLSIIIFLGSMSNCFSAL